MVGVLETGAEIVRTGVLRMVARGTEDWLVLRLVYLGW